MLNVFEPCTLQIGDRNYYTLKPDDVIMMRDEWKKLEKESYLKLTTSKKVNNNKKNNVKNDRIKKRPDEESSDEESEAEEAGESGEASKTKKTSVPSSTLNKKKKLKRSRKNSDRSSSMAALASLVDLKPGDKIIVETMCTKSEATVVWQDGSIEAGISSRELFPIHALDDQEYFPGDFVIRETSNAGGHTDQLITYDPHSYGVIQSVDHSGRTCSVKWFRTYTSGNEPQ
jgi:ubiquitin-conjugating enzyme E2 O